jgi:hypothetical protein
MLLSLAQWLQSISTEFGSFRVFQYLTFRAVMAALTALLIGLIAGPFKDRPADSRIRHANAFEQKRYADHGWCSDFVVHRHFDAVVGRSVESLCLDRHGRDTWIRRHRLG